MIFYLKSFITPSDATYLGIPIQVDNKIVVGCPIEEGLSTIKVEIRPQETLQEAGFRRSRLKG